MTRRDFDIWLHGFARETREAPPHAISRVFGIPVHAAEALVATLPRVVKRDASADQAERLVHALEAIGGVAEAVPTRVVAAPVLVVGTQPAPGRPETIIRHAPRAGASREHASWESGSSGDTLQLGTQELEAFKIAALLPSPELEALPPYVAPASLRSIPTSVQGSQGSPDATLVDKAPPRWTERELEPVHAALESALPEPALPEPALPEPALPEPALPEPRSRWDDLELPSEPEPPISLAPPPSKLSRSVSGHPSEIELTRNAHDWIAKVGQAPIPLTPLSSHPPPASNQSWITLTPHPVGSHSPPTWRNPMALPTTNEELRSLGMRVASERARVTRPRSQHPPSLIPGAPPPQPSFSTALSDLARGDLRGVARTSPTLAFALVLIGVTLLFLVAYAAI